MLFFGFVLLLMSTAYAVDVEESDVSLWFYQHPNYNEAFYKFTLNKKSTCDVNSPVDLSKNITIYIHGCDDVFKDEDYDLMQALVETQVNGIIMRMEYPCQPVYQDAVSTVTPYGTCLANFLLCLNNTYGYSLDKIRVIGHSLGAHIAGAAGSGTGGVLKSIVGLDPTGSLFDEMLGDRLEADDAEVVMVLHTSNSLGTVHPIGDYDVYFNGGISQPKCTTTIDDTRCNHVAAVSIYAESLYNVTLEAVQCSDYIPFLTEDCSGNDVAFVGGINPEPKARGKYYVDTDMPFGC